MKLPVRWVRNRIYGLAPHLDFQEPTRFAKTVADDTAFFQYLIAKANIEVE